MNARTQRLLDAQADTARTINRLMITLLGLGLVGALTLGFPDSYLLTTATTVSVPFAGGTSFKLLLIVGPILLIAVRAYLQIYIDQWHRLDRLTRRSQALRVPIVSPLRHPLLKLFSGFVLYALVPLVLGIFTWESMVFREWGTALLYVTVVCGGILICWAVSANRQAGLLVMPIGLAVIFIAMELDGAFDDFRRPFRLQLANLERAILSGQDLRDADLRNAILNGADLFGANLEGAYMERVEMRDAALLLANLKNVQLYKADLRDTNLHKAKLNPAYLGNSNLQGAQLTSADLTGASLIKVNLQGVNLRRANLHGAILSLADLRNTVLENVDLRNANLDRVDFRGAYLGNANLYDAQNWETADRTGVTFCRTTLPDGMVEAPECDTKEALKEWSGERRKLRRRLD